MIEQLRAKMPHAQPFLMYGLTEAFRSTYLSPHMIDHKKGSIGKAIPNAEVLVINSEGRECQADEIGELVHIGPLVSLGYWQNELATQERFKPTPVCAENSWNTPLAVYSGDYVKRDSDGYLYFISRQDEMIKTSGYRVSPGEIEEVILQHPNINEVVVLGIPHPELGQAIIAIFSLATDTQTSDADQNDSIKKQLLQHCTALLANYMLPKYFVIEAIIPKNANGKLDRNQLKSRYKDHFSIATKINK